MPPRAAGDYVLNGLVPHAVSGGDARETLATSARFANHDHVARGEFAIPVLLAPSRPSLRVLVRRVVGVGAKEEMGRIHARRYIAAMADVHPVGHGAVDALPGVAMRHDRLLATPNQRLVHEPPRHDSPMAKMATGPHSEPATHVRFGNHLGIKPLGVRHLRTLCRHAMIVRLNRPQVTFLDTDAIREMMRNETEEVHD